jgi:hypothetical protein
MRARIARAANIEWKYEYKRQKNLVKKLIEVSLMKAEYDNLTQDDKRKHILNNAIENQKSDAKVINNLIKDDGSPMTPRTPKRVPSNQF